MDEETTTLELGPDHSAIVFDGKGEITLLLPDHENDDDMPEHEVLLAGIAIQLQEPMFRRLILDFMRRESEKLDDAPAPPPERGDG